MEFFKTGLFAVGGGLATLPFLYEMGEKTGWFTAQDVLNLLAVSESTPGPMGVNMATYVGYTTAGIPGGIAATLGLVFPSVLIVLIIAKFLQKFRRSKGVDAVFYGLRSASVALITAAMLQVARIALFRTSAGVWYQAFHWPAIVLAAVIFLLAKFTPLKKLHPICFIGLAALVGIIFKL